MEIMELLRKDEEVSIVRHDCVVDFYLDNEEVSYNVYEISENGILKQIDVPTYEVEPEYVVYSVLNCLRY